MPTWALFAAGAFAALFAVLMLFQRTLYASAVCFLGVLLQISAVFYLCGAPLLAFLQAMIYAGAIMILMVVGIMATPSKIGGLWSGLGFPAPLTAAAFAFAAVELAALAVLGPAPSALAGPASIDRGLGLILFGRWALLTESVAVLIFLAALSVVEAWRSEPS